MNIFVSGSLAYDRIMDFPEKFSDHILPDKIHILNVCFTVNGVDEQFGGTAGNIAYNLALLGEKPIILSCAGRDFDSYEGWLRRLELPVHGIRRISDELTAGAYITTDKSDNQITGFNPGAMKHTCLFEFDGIDSRSAIAIVAPGNVEDMLYCSRNYKKKNIPYIFDPGQQIPVISTEFILEMLSGSKIFISNDYELEMVMRSTGLNKAQLLERTGAIVTTLGERGSLLLTKEQETQIASAHPTCVTDPTGAGDAYRAGLIKGLVLGKSLEESAKMGAVSGSFGVECKGTQCHSFTLEIFWERYSTNFG
jgi:adenosine kinase